MKNILFTILLSFFTVILMGSIHTNDVVVNPKNSTITWIGSKPTGQHSGTINISSGKLVFDHGRLVGGEVLLNMTSIKTTDIESKKKSMALDDHLKNEDFFNVEEYPTAKIVIVNAILTQDNMYKVSANLTIKGITNEITFATHIKIKQNNFLATANIKIDRTKWGIVYKSGNIFKDLGDKIIYDEIEFDIFLLSEK